METKAKGLEQSEERATPAPQVAGGNRLHGVALVVDGRCRTSQVIDLVDLERDARADVVSNDLEVMPVEQSLDVVTPAGEEVVEADHLVPRCEKALAQV